MNTIYDNETFEHNGLMFKAKIETDISLCEPWKEYDVHGVISDWTRRDKAPGERVLVEDRGSRLYYDIQQTMKIARKDGWGLSAKALAQLEAKLGRVPKQGEITQAAVEEDFKRMRQFCRGDWGYVYLVVVLLDEDGEETEYSASLGGMESDDDQGLFEESRILAEEAADLMSSAAEIA